MRVLICGKGGSGKSTVTTLLARALHNHGKTVLVVDADESNLCLHRLMGATLPQVLLEEMGGRQGARAQLKPTQPLPPEEMVLKDPMTLADIPEACLADADGIKLLVVGKIKEYGEGCACMIGNISKTLLARLRETKDEVVLIDAEAGLEHFGRRIDAACDLVLCVVDPTYESFAMAEKVHLLAAGAGVEAFYILNKVEEGVREIMASRLDSRRVIASLPRSDELFLQNLAGDPLTAVPTEIEDVRRFVTGYRKSVSLNIL